jgi:hypothetical protein
MKIATADDWNQVRYSDIASRGGATLLHMYGGSLSKALSAVYKTDFTKKAPVATAPTSVISSEEFLGVLSQPMDSSHIEKLYHSSKHQTVLQKEKRKEQQQSANKRISKGQTRLYKLLQEIFPGQEMHLSYKHPEMLHESSKLPMELGILI